MTLTRYNPELDFDQFTGRFFQDAVNRLASDNRPWSPSVDILETENEIVLSADVPGVKSEDIDVRVENGTLTLKGERKFEKQDGDKGKGYHLVERGYGSFARVFTLPDTLDSENVRADYKDGVLKVTLPKREIAKPKTVRVQVSNN